MTAPRTMSACLGVILVITAVVVAYVARRFWQARSGRKGKFFTYSTPAAPRVREGVLALQEALARVAALRRDFEERARLADPVGDADLAGGPACGAASFRAGGGPLLASLERIGAILRERPPTYANYLAVYRGLAGSGGGLARAADAYTEAGYSVHQALSPGAPRAGYEAELGNLLLAMGDELRLVARAVHRLGVALDVE